MIKLLRRRLPAKVKKGAATPPDGSAALAAEGSYEFAPELVTLVDMRGRQAGALQAIAGELVTRHVEAGHRGLAVCGVSQSVGVSFSAANLAIALSQRGVSVLLVDANLRRPGLHRLIRPPAPARGLRDLLSDPDLRPGDVIHPHLLPGLSVVYAGLDETTSHQELLGGEGFRRFIEAALRDFDCTLVDTPAANQTADARRIATVLGYALVIARRNQTFADDVTTIVRELKDDGVTVVGTVLNDA